MPIDIHAHYVPASLIDAIRMRGPEFGVAAVLSAGSASPALHFDYGFKVRPFFPKLVEPIKARRTWLDQRGLDRQLLATWPDIYGYGLEREKCVAWHRVLNDTLGELCAEHGDRFSFVASVPLPNADDAAAELDRALDRGAVAVMISSNVEGINLGELSLDPFWARAEATQTPVIIHPVLVTPAPRAAKFGLTQIVQYTFDTTLGVGSLLFTGLLDRFPNLTVVLAHGGGALPYLIGRFDLVYSRTDHAAVGTVSAHPPSAYLKRLAYDSIVHAPQVLRFLADSVGIDRVLVGTDDSFPPADNEPMQKLRDAGFSANEIDAIADGNPRRLFPRLAAS